MLGLPLLGLIFSVVMSTNQETSDSDIFCKLSVIVMKYSFQLNHGDPLCEIVSSKNHCDVESGESWGRGFG